MRWLFGTGIALDISGAVMVLGAILRARVSEVATEAVSYPGWSEARLKARVEERQYAIAGVGLLVSGFLLQLAGYAWTFSSWWLVGYSVALAALVTLVAFRHARRISPGFAKRAFELMLRKAVE
jgi:hypothetical protein